MAYIRMRHQADFGCKLGAKWTQFAPNFTDFSSPNHPVSLLECMAGTTGLEPATSAVTGQHSNQLNYVPTCFSTTCRKLHDLLIFRAVHYVSCFYHFYRI